MIWQIISYQNKDYVRDHRSIGLFWEWCFCEEFGSECFGLFLFYFCLVRGEKVASAQDIGWWSKGEDHFKSWFPFFSCLLVTILYCSYIVWSKDLSAYFPLSHMIFLEAGRCFYFDATCAFYVGGFVFCFVAVNKLFCGCE